MVPISQILNNLRATFYRNALEHLKPAQKKTAWFIPTDASIFDIFRKPVFGGDTFPPLVALVQGP